VYFVQVISTATLTQLHVIYEYYYRHIVVNEEDVPKWTLETVMERIQGHTLMELVPQIQDTILSNKVIPHLLGFDSIRFYTAPVLPKVP
jgi:hypothetical protein